MHINGLIDIKFDGHVPDIGGDEITTTEYDINAHKKQTSNCRYCISALGEENTYNLL